MIFGFLSGRPENLQPLFQHDAAGGGEVWTGVVAVLLTTPFWLSGFNLVAQVMEEKRPNTPSHHVAWMIVLAIVMSSVFYILLTLASASVTPWPQLVSADLPAARAFELAFRSVVLARLVLVTALLGTVTVWNGAAIAASRMLFALGRARIIGGGWGELNARYSTPTAAIVFVGISTTIGVLLGRKAIGPVISIASTCFAAAYLMVCIAVARLRVSHPSLPRPFRVPGGIPTMAIGALASLVFLGLSFKGQWSDAHGGFPLEWGVIVVWALLGVTAWAMAGPDATQYLTRARQAVILGDQALIFAVEESIPANLP